MIRHHLQANSALFNDIEPCQIGAEDSSLATMQSDTHVYISITRVVLMFNISCLVIFWRALQTPANWLMVLPHVLLSAEILNQGVRCDNLCITLIHSSFCRFAKLQTQGVLMNILARTQQTSTFVVNIYQLVHWYLSQTPIVRQYVIR